MEFSDSHILQFNLLTIFVLLTVFCSLVFRRNNVKANILLALLVFYPISTISYNLIAIYSKNPSWLFLNYINIAINFTFGPALLTYLALIQGKSFVFKRIRLWELFPSLLSLLLAIYYFFCSTDHTAIVVDEIHAGTNAIANVFNFSLLLHFGIYLYIGWKRIQLYADRAFELGFEFNRNYMLWQKAFLRCLVLLNILLSLVYVFFIVLTGKSHIYADLVFVPFFSLAFYVFLIFKGISYHVVFDRPSYNTLKNTALPLNSYIEEIDRFKKGIVDQRLSSTQQEQFKIKLSNLFLQDKIHVKPGLKLVEAAERLQVKPSFLSNFINNELNSTFFEMVNSYRSEEAKAMLLSPEFEKFKIEYIGEKAGFNSRASFFRVFKQCTGSTPLEFRESRMNRATNHQAKIVVDNNKALFK